MTAGQVDLPADRATWAMREKLGAVDTALVELLAERFRLVRELWAHKLAVGLPLEDRPREARTLQKLRGEAERRGLPPELVESIFRSVIAEGKRRAGDPRSPAPPGPPARVRGPAHLRSALATAPGRREPSSRSRRFPPTISRSPPPGVPTPATEE